MLMADDKKGRDKQAHDQEKRQRKRELSAELERADEPEPPIDPIELAALETEFEQLTYPATGADIVAELGDREVESTDGNYPLADLVPETVTETFDSPTEVRQYVQRPTVAAAVKRVVEASETLPNTTLSDSQRNAYQRTFRELKAIDAVDDDEGIAAIRDWIVAEIDDRQKIPGSRAVRRQAAKYCRENGYQVRNDDWLGI